MSDSHPPSRIQSVSLILIVDSTDDIDAQVWSTTRALGKLGFRVEPILLCTDPQALPRITYRPLPQLVHSVAEAIERSRYSQVAIVDRGFEITPGRWECIQQLDPETVRVFAQRHRPISRTKQVWMWLLMMMTRLLIKTRKHEFSRGFTLFRLNQIKHFAGRLSGSSPNEDVLQLLGLTRQQGQAASEIIAFSRSPDTSPLSSGRRSKDYRRAIARVVRWWFQGLAFPAFQSAINRAKPKKRRQLAMTGLLFAIASLLLLGGLDYPLFEPDEVRNAQIAINLNASQDWSVLTLRQEPYWDKPPLQHWCLAISHALFGASPWSTRLPVALASMVTIALTFFVGRRIVGFYPAWLAAMCLVLTVGFLLISRFVTMDAMLATMVTGTLLFGWLAIPGLGGRQKVSRKNLALASLFAGLGLLTKGPLILVLCVPPLLASAWLLKVPSQSNPTSLERRKRRRKVWLAALLPATLVAGPWFLWTLIFHPTFFTVFFWKHNVVRFVDGFNHQQPFYFYLLGIFLFMFPVSYLFPSLLRFLVTQKREAQQWRSRELGVLAISVVWMFVFFSMATSKLATYIVPTFPLIALMLGCFLERQVFATQKTQGSFLRSLVRRGPWELPAWCLAVCVVAVLFFDVSLNSVLPIGCAAIALGAFALVGRRKLLPRRAKRTYWLSFAGISLLIGLTAVQVLFPAIARQRSDLAALEVEMKNGDYKDEVFFVGRDAFSATMELPISIAEYREDCVENAAEQLAALPEHARRWVVASNGPLAKLKASLEKNDAHVTLTKSEYGRHLYFATRQSSDVRHAKRDGSETLRR